MTNTRVQINFYSTRLLLAVNTRCEMIAHKKSCLKRILKDKVCFVSVSSLLLLVFFLFLSCFPTILNAELLLLLLLLFGGCGWLWHNLFIRLDPTTTTIRNTLVVAFSLLDSKNSCDDDVIPSIMLYIYIEIVLQRLLRKMQAKKKTKKYALILSASIISVHRCCCCRLRHITNKSSKTTPLSSIIHIAIYICVFMCANVPYGVINIIGGRCDEDWQRNEPNRNIIHFRK